MQFTLMGLWAHMGLFARLIVIVLGIMSLASLLVTAERAVFFMKSRGDSERYAKSIEQMLASGALIEAAGVKAGANGGYLGRVVEAGLRTFTRSQNAPADFVVESVGRALERQAQREVQTLKRGQSVVATVSSTAPFVGLLGTVMGIVSSFQAMASTGSGGLGTVSAGIAEALVTTAFGLLVAIPAVMAFNWLQSWIDARAVDLSESSNELLDVVARTLKVGSRPISMPAPAGGAPVGSIPPPPAVPGSMPPPGGSVPPPR